MMKEIKGVSKVFARVSRVFLIFGVFFEMSAQQFPTPPNDNFADRTILDGSSLTVTGNLVGASSEIDEPTPHPFLKSSVWWSWRAPASGLAVIEVMKASGWLGVFYVFRGADLRSLQSITGVPFGPKYHTAFAAAAGTEYHIAVLGDRGVGPAQFTFNLLLTNGPYFVQQPRTQTISPGGSALFTVSVADSSPVQTQWQLNDVDLPGRTDLMLALDNVTSEQAGDYRVLATRTNPDGSKVTTTSMVGRLVVNAADDVQPRLVAREHSPNLFTLGIIGEEGRNYRILSSTNLLDWSDESSFASSSLAEIRENRTPAQTSIVLAFSNLTFLLPTVTDSKFFRASRYHAANEICNNNLKQIRFAKALWSMEFVRAINEPTVDREVEAHIPGGLPICPSGGVYFLYAVGTTPGCSLAGQGHVLEEP